MNQHTRYERARERVQQIKDVSVHLAVYVLVNVVFIRITMVTGEHWSIWPLLGWGIGVVIHALTVWGVDQWWGRAWEARDGAADGTRGAAGSAITPATACCAHTGRIHSHDFTRRHQ